MTGRRTYGEGCPVAHSLDLIGERWALLVVRELRLGPRRYRDLQEALPGITPAVLSQRLKDLEETGVLHRRELPSPARARVYELTEWGAELEPVFRALARWGVRSPVVPLAGPVSSDSIMLGLRTFLDGRAVRPWRATYAVHLGRDVYRLRIVDGAVDELARGATAGAADVVIRCDRDTWQAVLDGDVPVRAAMDGGGLAVTGDVDALQRLIDASRTSAPSPSP